MNKRLLFLLLLFAGMANAQTVNIPDPVFKIMLLAADTNNTFALDAASNPIKIDTNSDGEIQVSEALTVYQLNLGSTAISDMTGITSFANLRVLDCHGNLLTSLDVNGLTNLTRLDCSGNVLTSLDVSGVTNLNFLFCDVNQIASLNVGNLAHLKFVSCNSNNLSTLNINGLPELLSLTCSNNQIANLTLSNLPQLTMLQCSYNQLTSLNVNNLATLTQLLCFYNQLTSLEVSNLTSLTYLSCGENNITTLNLDGLTNLTSLECSYSPNNLVINGANLDALTNFIYTGQNSVLTLNGFPNVNDMTLNLNQPSLTLNITGFSTHSNIHIFNSPMTSLTVNGSGATNLEALNCTNNQLTSLTLNGLNNLLALNCSSNDLVNLNLAGLAGLTQLNCSMNRITNLDLSGVPNLKHLNCNNNKLAGLNVAGLPALEYLDCSNTASIDIVGNQITSLDVEGLTNLKYLDFSNYQFNGVLGAAGNLVTSINVNNLSQLQQLKCSKNNISTLVVNGLTELTYLDCSYNLLTSLDLIGLTNLTHLNYSSNQLSNLNMTGLVNITELNCSGNAISTLNVVNMPNLTKLNCSNNTLTTLNLSGLNLLTELYLDNNQVASLDVNTMTNLTSLSCNSNQLTTLEVYNLAALKFLGCSGNQLTSLNVGTLSELNSLNCSSNQLASLDVSALGNLNELSCTSNELTTLDVSNSPLLRALACSENQLSTLDIGNQASLYSLACGHNQLTGLIVNGSTNLVGLYCEDNQLTTLDVSALSRLTDLWCQDNSLTELFLKNGSNESALNFSNNPALTYICADDIQLANVQALLNGLGMNATVCNSYCTFTPGGPHNTVIGTTIFDGNNNGCNINDPLHPNIRVDFTDGFTTGSAFTNTNGICTFYADAGSYILFPNIENAAAFNISPASATISFPDNNYNISNQSFCLSANGVHPDLEVVISPISPARPGFDATYEIVYKNKGNQELSGNVTLAFDDSRLDLVTATPAADTQTANSLEWVYTSLLPFESRTIALEFNVNSPTDTPAVNNGDVLNFTASITPVAGDELASDNTFTYNQVVVNSFDPNDITCLQGNSVSPSEIGNYLHYIVNFENTGTASAVNIVVRVEVDESQYDLHSLQVLNTSHNSRTVIRGNIVEFMFEDIQLEASAGDPPVGGHGNVLFKIRSNDGLDQGDVVTKQADIYFDYNAPIVTNEAETVFESLGNPDVSVDQSVTIYPNPSSGIVNVKSDSEIRSVELFDIQGRLLQNKLNSNFIDLSSRANGMYFVRVTTDKGIKVEKIVRN